MEDLDTAVEKVIVEPTEWGFYKYSGGNQIMIFMLEQRDGVNQWWVWFAQNPTPGKCEWGYIEQALTVYDLEKIV